MKYDVKPVVESSYCRIDGDRIVCEICPVMCRLGEGQIGLCRGRMAKEGKIIAINYGETVALHLDPIEKKPLYHVKPGKPVWSAGPNGCNLRCRWCQNSTISQEKTVTRYFPPEKLADVAMSEGSAGLAYTYTEPLIWFEYLLDVMPEVKRQGGLNILVTNGYIEEKPLRELLPWVDAANIDLKFMDEQLYRKFTGGRLESILRTIRIMHDEGKHIELTHLVVTGLADDLDHTRRLVEWIAELDCNIPLHISGYTPRHKWSKPPTSPQVIMNAWEIARQSLRFVYLGNMAALQGADTICPDCGATAVNRRGYYTRVDNLRDGKCGNCGCDLNFLIS